MEKVIEVDNNKKYRDKKEKREKTENKKNKGHNKSFSMDNINESVETFSNRSIKNKNNKYKLHLKRPPPANNKDDYYLSKYNNKNSKNTNKNNKKRNKNQSYCMIF